MVGSETADLDWVPDSLQGIEILLEVRREMRFLRCIPFLWECGKSAAEVLRSVSSLK